MDINVYVYMGSPLSGIILSFLFMVVINLFITHLLTVLTYVKIVEERHSPHPHILKEQVVYPET